jgi:arsenate reductase-like glutaredoxin family protein
MPRYSIKGPDGKTYSINGPEGASREEVIAAIQREQQEPIIPTETPDATFGESLKDIGVSALQGVLGAKEAITGIADIPTMGIIGRGVAQAEKDLFGGTSQDAREKLQKLKSAEAQQEEKEIAETKGFLPTAGAYLKRPGALVGMITESIPTMLGGAGIARGAVGSIAKVAGKEAAPLIAGAVGEGAVTAGSIAESTRQESESGLITPEQAGVATLAGAFTGGLGVFGGRVAKRLGVGDFDTLMAGGVSDAEKKSILKQAVKGALSESVFEELPQSMQEQIMQNINTGRPPLEGVAEAGASGMLAGAVMGGTASAISQAKDNAKIANQNNPNPPPETENETLVGDINKQEPAKQQQEDLDIDDILSTEEKIDEQLKPTKPRKGVQVSRGPTDGAAGVTEGADGSGVVRDRVDSQSVDVGAGTQPTALTKESILGDMAAEGLQFKNTTQVRNYLKTKVDKSTLAQLEMETPTLVKELFDENNKSLKEKLKTQKAAEEAEEVKSRLLKLEEANKQAIAKNEQELSQEQYDALHPYLKTKSSYGKEAPLTLERGIDSVAAEEAFIKKDLRDVEGFEAELTRMAQEKTAEAQAARKATIDKLMKEERLNQRQAERRVGNYKSKQYNFSKDRPYDFLTEGEFLSLQEKYDNKKAPNPVQIKEAQLRQDFINNLTPEQQALVQQKIQERLANEQLLAKKALIKERGQKGPQGTEITPEEVETAGEFINEFSYQNLGKFLADKVKQLRGNVNIVYGKVPGNKPGMFDPSTNTITVDRDNFGDRHEGQIVTHELMHYMMDHIIDNRNVPGFLSNEQKAALNRLENLRKEAVRKLGGTFTIPNLKEFVAEAFTNRDFQQALASLEPPPGKVYEKAKGLVRRIAQAILDSLGLKGLKPAVLEETLDLIESIITDQNYRLPDIEKGITGKGISFAPKQAGVPKLYDREKRLEELTVSEYHKPTAIETVKKTLIGEKARANLITKYQNDRYAIKNWQKDLMTAGKITVGGPNFTNIYDQITLGIGEADFRNKEYLMAPIQNLQNLINQYAKAVNKSVGAALAELHEYAEALHEPERRKIKYLKYTKLNNTTKYRKPQTNTITTAADEREKIFQVLASNNSLSPEQIKGLRARLEYLVENYKDPAGAGTYSSPDINSAEYNVTKINSQEAQHIIKIYENSPHKKLLDEVIAALKPIQQATLELNRQGNHLSNSTNNFINFYGFNNYIPLKGYKGKLPDNSIDFETDDKRLSRELKDAAFAFEGRLSEAENPIIQTMVESAISAARAGRKGLTQSIKNAVNSNKLNPNGQGILDGEVVANYTPLEVYKGLDSTAQQLINQRSSIVHYNEDGSMDVIRIKDPALLESIRRTYKDSHPLLDMVNRFTSLVGQSHTRYNPAFPVLNFVRDTLTNAFVMAIDIGPLEAFKYIGAVSAQVVNGGLFKANKVARLYAKGDIQGLRQLAKKDPYSADMIDYIEQGGLVSIVQGLSVKSQLGQLYKELNQSKILKVKEQIDPFFDAWVSTFELAARSAAYRIAKSDAEARGIKGDAAKEVGAVYAKQLANFEEVGEWGKTLGALFVFFRPSATGAVRAFETIGPMLRSWESVKRSLPETITKDPKALAEYEANWRKQSRTAATVVLSLLGAGASIYLMSALSADDDDEGRNKIFNDDLARWTRFARFDIGEDKVVQIPWGFGLGGFMAAGAQIAGAFSSKTNSLADIFSNIVNIGLDSFVPLPVSRINMVDNPSAFVLDSVTPSLARPFFEYAMNMNAFGQEIYNNRQSRYGNAYTGGDNIPDAYKDAARFMADNWGIDASPNSLYFFANNYMDGLTRIMHNGYGLGLTLAGQKDFDAKRDLFILESFISTKSNVDQREFAKMEESIKKKERLLKMFETNPVKYADYISKHPLDAALVDMYNEMINGELKQLREDANQFRRLPGLSPKERKALLDPIKDIQNLTKRQITHTVNLIDEIESD